MLSTRQFKIPLHKKFIAALLFLGLGKSSSAAEALALRRPVVSTFEGDRSLRLEELFSAPPSDTLKNRISGVVVDQENKSGIHSAVVRIKDSDIVTLTDEHGKFTLTIPGRYLNQDILLIVSYVGYNSLEKIVEKVKLPFHTEFLLTQSNHLTGEVLVVGGVYLKKKKWWQFGERNKVIILTGTFTLKNEGDTAT